MLRRAAAAAASSGVVSRDEPDTVSSGFTPMLFFDFFGRYDGSRLFIIVGNSSRII